MSNGCCTIYRESTQKTQSNRGRRVRIAHQEIGNAADLPCSFAITNTFSGSLKPLPNTSMNPINDFINRLGKNLKHQIKWAKRQNIEAWRIYDKDIPQFPFAIDVYGEHIHLQEYDTGWLMQPEDYRQWLEEVCEAVQFVTGFPKQNIHLKQRARQKGSAQYEKTGAAGEDFIVREHGRAFWVNLDKYLDTGLFLDHRNTRQKVGNMAQGKRFLNLFSYTGSFTVYAATGGATASETVDLSNTYLDWAKKNFELNQIDLNKHTLIRADVFQYLTDAAKQQKQFDLIVLDPPSFSNSKKMPDILDIQRDHAALIDGSMALLARDGVLFFSNNLRSFTLDETLGARYAVKDVSKQSVPEDFRNKKIHQCWEIRHHGFQAA